MKSGFIYMLYEFIRIVWKFSLERMYEWGCLRSGRIVMKIQVSRCFLDTRRRGEYSTLFKITLADFILKVHFMSLVFNATPRLLVLHGRESASHRPFNLEHGFPLLHQIPRRVANIFFRSCDSISISFLFAIKIVKRGWKFRNCPLSMPGYGSLEIDEIFSSCKY